MRRSISDNKKSRRGRPATTGTGTLIGVRVHDDQLAELDRWIAAQFVPYSRPEAIRLLAEIGMESLLRAAVEKPALPRKKR